MSAAATPLPAPALESAAPGAPATSGGQGDVAPARHDGWGHAALFTPHTGWLALFCIAASFIMPFEGFGIDLCGLHRLTGLPCPGCGLTRAFIALAQGDLLVALGSNPFVLVLYPLFIVLGVIALAPAGIRARVEGWLARNSSRVGRVYRVGLFAFLGFGMARFAWFLFMGERFP